MYFITCFCVDESKNECTDSRTFGYFADYNECQTALHENWCDIHEFYYSYAVVEKISSGIHSRPEKVVWFKWDDEKEGFYEAEKPEWANSWYGFALG